LPLSLDEDYSNDEISKRKLDRLVKGLMIYKDVTAE
jgi:hypothetical protein